MACFHCRRNEAVKSYERTKNGIVITEDYCLDCYHRLFLCVKDAEGGMALSVCPYCGVKAEDVLSKKLVGCAYCYQMLEETLMPMIIQMQGVELHNGKRPTTELLNLWQDGVAEKEESDEEQNLETKARFARQCNELEMIIAKLLQEKRFDEAKGYADKLSRMKSGLGMEEDFVWRGNSKTLTR